MSHLDTNGQDEPSRKSQIISSSLRAFNSKEAFFKKLTTNPGRDSKKLAPGRLSRKLQVGERFVERCRILTIVPEKESSQHILLLHGGAYVAEATRGHRLLMEKLALEHGFTVTFIAYPLAPESKASQTIEVVFQVYLDLIIRHPEDDFYLLGDSAGGGLALVLLQILKEREIVKRPSKSVLLSPWLDISLENPHIDEYIEKDVILSLEGLKKCGQQYAGELDLNDPIVSPIEGDMNDLQELKVYVSSHELFYPDCLLLKQKIHLSEGTSIDLSIKYKMLHDWIIFPIRESDETIWEIAVFFSNKI